MKEKTLYPPEEAARLEYFSNPVNQDEIPNFVTELMARLSTFELQAETARSIDHKNNYVTRAQGIVGSAIFLVIGWEAKDPLVMGAGILGYRAIRTYYNRNSLNPRRLAEARVIDVSRRLQNVKEYIPQEYKTS